MNEVFLFCFDITVEASFKTRLLLDKDEGKKRSQHNPKYKYFHQKYTCNPKKQRGNQQHLYNTISNTFKALVFATIYVFILKYKMYTKQTNCRMKLVTESLL